MTDRFPRAMLGCGTTTLVDLRLQISRTSTADPQRLQLVANGGNRQIHRTEHRLHGVIRPGRRVHALVFRPERRRVRSPSSSKNGLRTAACRSSHVTEGESHPIARRKRRAAPDRVHADDQGRLHTRDRESEFRNPGGPAGVCARPPHVETLARHFAAMMAISSSDWGPPRT